MKENALVDLSKQFAVDIVNLCTEIKERRKGNVLLNQLLRSGTSIGANIHEANYAASKADFINKLQIALKECYETDYWLGLFRDTYMVTQDEYDVVFARCSKIRKLLTASITTAKGINREKREESPAKHTEDKYGFIYELEQFFQKNPHLLYPSLAQKEYALREKGKKYDLNDHCKALILSKLSNRQKWHKVEKNKSAIQTIFKDYSYKEILAEDENYFIEELRKIHCDSQVMKRDFSNLHQNIRVLLQIEEKYGSVDAFLLSAPAHEIVENLSSDKSRWKMKTIGPALAWEYLRNVGIDGAKPDIHLKRILSAERLSLSQKTNMSEEEFFAIMTDMKAATNKLYIELDNYLWSYCAEGQAKICGETPHCDRCVIKAYCKRG